MSQDEYKKIFAKKLKHYMALKGKTQKDLIEDLGFKSPTVSDWCNGKKLPRMDKLEILADYFGVNKSDLYEEKLPSNMERNYESIMRPVVGNIAAGLPALADEHIIGYEPVDVRDPDTTFWLMVHGDSMKGAGIYDGDKVLIRQQTCAENGQIVACRVNGEEATLKRFRRQKDSVILLPENPSYEPRIIPLADFESGDAAIIGVAIQIKRNL